MTERIRTYIISAGFAPTYLSELEYFIQHDQRILAYWNYIPGLYFVKSDLSAEQLTKAISPFLYKTPHYIVSEVNVQNMNGQLPRTAWEWFYEPVLDNALARRRASPLGSA